MQKLIVVILALLLLISSGCTNQEEQKVRKAVEDYNQKLIQVMANGKIDELNTVALEQEVRRIQLFLTFLNDEHKIMNADLLEFKIIDIKPATSKTKDGKK